jgi:hypothetical protein
VTGISTAAWRFTARLAVGLGLLLLVPYAWAPIYTFPEPAAFAGHDLWNPYQSLTGTWQRANLHAHGKAWMGLTSGAQSDQVVADRYRSLGYDVAGISDYQRIAAFHGIDTPPIYEHGFNIGKNHQLAIGARGVDWFDLPLWQWPSHQQYVIDRVKQKSALVALNHPSSRDAYGADAMRSLTNFDLIEIVNGPFVVEDVWDAALSSGRPVWALGNDDTHDLTDIRRTAAAWNMIDAPSTSTDAIVSALRAGRSYAVLRTGAIGAAQVTTLASLNVHGDTITVTLNGAPSTVTFIGQDGIVRAAVKDTTAASYAMTGSDPYVRTVVTSPQTVLYLNPVIRWDGRTLPSPVATVDSVASWLQRGGLAFACVLLVVRKRVRNVEEKRAARAIVAQRANPQDTTV